MMAQGLWVLAFVIVLDNGDLVLQTYDTFANQQVCLAWKDREARDHLRVMTCYQQYEYKI